MAWQLPHQRQISQKFTKIGWWRNRKYKKKAETDNTGNKKPLETKTPSPDTKGQTSNTSKNDNSKKKEPEKGTTTSKGDTPGDENAPQVEDARLKYSLLENTTFFVSEIGNGGALYQSRVGSSADTETDDLPNWAIDCLVYKKLNAPDTPKVSFYLNPFTPCDDELPQLPNSNNRLSAVRILIVRKVIGYVISKLNLQLPVLPETPIECYIEIVCNDKVLDPDMSLATIKQFLWRSNDELILLYRKTPKYSKK